MPDYSQMTVLELKIQLDKLHVKLSEKEPLLTAEIGMVRSFIEQKEKTTEGKPHILYNDVRFPKDAVDKALTLNGDFTLTQEDLVTQICDGGYLHTGKSSSRALINSTVNNAIRSGALIKKHNKVGRPSVIKSK